MPLKQWQRLKQQDLTLLSNHNHDFQRIITISLEDLESDKIYDIIQIQQNNEIQKIKNALQALE